MTPRLYFTIAHPSFSTYLRIGQTGTKHNALSTIPYLYKFESCVATMYLFALVIIIQLKIHRIHPRGPQAPQNKN